MRLNRLTYECIRPSVQSYINQYFCDSATQSHASESEKSPQKSPVKTGLYIAMLLNILTTYHVWWPDEFAGTLYRNFGTVPHQFTWRNHLKFRCGSERLTAVETLVPARFGMHISVTCMSKCVYSLGQVLCWLNWTTKYKTIVFNGSVQRYTVKSLAQDRC